MTRSAKRKQPRPQRAQRPAPMLMAIRLVGASCWPQSLALNIKQTQTPFAKKWFGVTRN
jgi:hypothetical protein